MKTAITKKRRFFAVGWTIFVSWCVGCNSKPVARGRPPDALLKAVKEGKIPVTSDMQDARLLVKDVGAFYELRQRWPESKSELFETLQQEGTIASDPERFRDLRIGVDQDGRQSFTWTNAFGREVSISVSE